MDAVQIKLVQDSFAKVVPIAEQAAEIFYGKLFAKDPSLKNMFKGDMKEQGKKLMTMLGVAVNGLNNLDGIVAAVQDLGKRHAGYGVTDAMYGTVAESLLETLEAGLGDEFTTECKAAWVEVYTLLATTMQDAAKSVELTDGPGLTPKKIKLVQDSFAKVVPIAEAAADIFYTKLFELDPSLKPMFKGDIKEQGKKLMAMLAAAVNELSNVPALIPVVQDLGKRHVGYGVTDQMYGTVASALLDTLAAGLGPEFTKEVKEAWIEVYTVLSTTMKDAAASVTPPPPTKKWYEFWK